MVLPSARSLFFPSFRLCTSKPQEKESSRGDIFSSLGNKSPRPPLYKHLMDIKIKFNTFLVALVGLLLRDFTITISLSFPSRLCVLFFPLFCASASSVKRTHKFHSTLSITFSLSGRDEWDWMVGEEIIYKEEETSTFRCKFFQRKSSFASLPTNHHRKPTPGPPPRHQTAVSL